MCISIFDKENSETAEFEAARARAAAHYERPATDPKNVQNAPLDHSGAEDVAR